MATADVTYEPGALTAVIGDQCWALVAVPPNSPAVGRTWRQLGRRAVADVLLAGLVADGLDGMSGFSLLVAEPDGQYRLFCRGTVGATVVAGPVLSGPAVRVDGAGLLTWREQVLGSAERVILGEPPAGAELCLPATSGVLLAGCVVVDLAGDVPHSRVVSAADEPAWAPVVPAAVDPVPAAATPIVPAPVAAEPVPVVAEPAPAAPDPAAAEPSAADVAADADEAEEYDFFWGATRTRSVEGAAVRGTGDEQARSGPGAGDSTWAVPIRGGQVPAASSAAPATLAVPAPAAVAGAPAVLPSGPPVMAGDSLIVPGGPPAMIGAPPVAPGGPPGGPGPGTGGLIDVPPWMCGPDAGDPGVSDPGAGDPDPTLKRGELPAVPVALPPPDSISPMVPALLCPDGHINPPIGAACRQCGAPLSHDPVSVPRPVLGRLRLSTGDVITLDRGVLLGRSPSTDSRVDGGTERPHVVKLPSTASGISRTHVRVTLDGWHVLVTDLHSTNGTLVRQPGRENESLRPGEPLLIQPGAVVTLADGVDFCYEAAE